MSNTAKKLLKKLLCSHYFEDDIKDVISLLKVIEILSAVFPPLYVGIAINQTLTLPV